MEIRGEFPLYIVLTLAGMGLAMGLVPLLLAWLWARAFAPAKPGAEKNAPYECGLASTGDPGGHQCIHYYLYAIVFLVFDVESVFLVPIAAATTGLPVGALVATSFFLLLLVEGLVWAWRKGILSWH